MTVAEVDKRAAVAPLARAELARRHLGDFLALLVPDYQATPHTRLLCARLEALERRETRRLIVSMPPRHGKTLHVSQALVAWYLGRDPTEQVILASYAAELAEANSRRARGFVLDPRWPWPQLSVDAGSAAVARWSTSMGGSVIAAGVGGGITGFGAHLLVVDDPVKGREEADSKTIRDSAWSWWGEVALTRLMPNAVVLVMGTRWHEDDLIGRILNSTSADTWDVLSLPALAEDDDPLGRPLGAALWPDWYPEQRLNSLRLEIGERAFSSLYLQNPTPERGGVFQRDWLTGRYETLPRPGQLHVVQAVDSAFKTGVANDYSVVATWASDGRWFYLVDVWRGRVEFPDLVRAITTAASQHNPAAILVEDTAAGQSAIQELRRSTTLPLVPVKPTGSKVSRAEAISPLAEAGKLLLPAVTPSWLGPWVEEHVAFPTGRHDDQVDTTSLALERLRRHARTSAAAADIGWLPSELDGFHDRPPRLDDVL